MNEPNSTKTGCCPPRNPKQLLTYGLLVVLLVIILAIGYNLLSRQNEKQLSAKQELLLQHAQPFLDQWNKSLFGLQYYMILDQCTTAYNTLLRHEMKNQFTLFISLKVRFDAALKEIPRNIVEITHLIDHSVQYLQEYPLNESFCSSDVTCNRCAKGIRPTNYTKYLQNWYKAFYSHLDDQLFDGWMNLSLKHCATTDWISTRMLTKRLQQSQQLRHQLSAWRTLNASEAQEVIHSSKQFINRLDQSEFCVGACWKCSQEMKNLTAKWSEYWEYYSKLAEPIVRLWLEEGRHLKAILTLDACFKTVFGDSDHFGVAEEKRQINDAFWRAHYLVKLFQKQHSISTETPKEIGKMLQRIKIAARVVHNEEAGSFCRGLAKCEECSKSISTDYQTNWLKHLKYYSDTLAYLYQSGPEQCLLDLANLCGSPIEKSIRIHEDARHELGKELLWSYHLKEQPNATQYATFIEQFQSVVTYFTNETNLCLDEAEAECQQCLEENVDCWNSIGRRVCETEEEWLVIGYRPKKVGVECKTVSVRGMVEFP